MVDLLEDLKGIKIFPLYDYSYRLEKILYFIINQIMPVHKHI
jgi:hypothetical protein